MHNDERLGVIFLHDNVRPNSFALTKDLLQQFKWKVFEHPPYSTDLAPRDYHLFSKLKYFLGGNRYGSDDEPKKAVND